MDARVRAIIDARLGKDIPIPRVRSCEDNPNAKLTRRAVMQIKRRLAQHETRRSIAKMFGVAKGTIDFIKAGQTWKDVPVHQWKGKGVNNGNDATRSL